MKSEIEHIHTLINKELKNLALPEAPSNLYDPIRYILELGGKRVRPMLALLTYSLYKDNLGDAIKPALALEVFHNFTLVHDDIMDEAPLRRGKETVHTKWNNNIGILSGDVMLVEAYKLLTYAPNEALPQLLSKFNSCAIEVCEGQQKDMDFEERSYVSVDEYLEMIRQKTAVLLGFSMEFGALLAGAPKEDCELLYNTGVNLGLAFQLQDDLLDLYGDEAFGKQIGGDIINRKKSILITKALELSGSNTNGLLAIYNDIKIEPVSKVAKIKSLFDTLNVRYHIEQLINKYDNDSNKNLSLLHVPNSNEILLNLISDLKTRVT